MVRSTLERYFSWAKGSPIDFTVMVTGIVLTGVIVISDWLTKSLPPLRSYSEEVDGLGGFILSIWSALLKRNSYNDLVELKLCASGFGFTWSEGVAFPNLRVLQILTDSDYSEKYDIQLWCQVIQHLDAPLLRTLCIDEVDDIGQLMDQLSRWPALTDFSFDRVSAYVRVNGVPKTVKKHDGILRLLYRNRLGIGNPNRILADFTKYFPNASCWTVGVMDIPSLGDQTQQFPNIRSLSVMGFSSFDEGRLKLKAKDFKNSSVVSRISPA